MLWNGHTNDTDDWTEIAVHIINLETRMTLRATTLSCYLTPSYQFIVSRDVQETSVKTLSRHVTPKSEYNSSLYAPPTLMNTWSGNSVRQSTHHPPRYLHAKPLQSKTIRPTLFSTNLSTKLFPQHIMTINFVLLLVVVRHWAFVSLLRGRDH